MRLTLFLLLGLLAAPAAAQPFANAPLPGADFLRADGGDPVPDTTAPWQYYPLEIGNVWEYEEQDLFGNDTGRTLRRHVAGDTLAPNGHRYFFIEIAFFSGGAREAGGFVALRYDTLSARVVELYHGGVEDASPEVPCPLDADFGSVAECFTGELYDVTGGYDGVLDFEPDTTVTGVPYKTYETSYEVIRYVAGFGEVLYVKLKGLEQYVLEACRVGGEEYGMLRYPVASEDGVPEMEALTLSAYPNPFRDRLAVAFELAQAGPVVVEVVDVLGRIVRRRDLGVLPSGRREVVLGGAGLPAGMYVVRVAAGEGRAERRIVRVR